MSRGNRSWDTQYQLCTGATIGTVISASDKTHLTNLLDDQHDRPLYLMIVKIENDIRFTPKLHTRIVVWLIPCPPKVAKNIVEACHSTVGTVLSQLRHLDITSPGLRLDSADVFQRQCYTLWAAWVREYPVQVMVAQVSHGSYPMCEFSKGAPMGY